MRSIPPIGVSLVDESKVRLVDQRGGLQDVPGPLVSKSGGRPATQLVVDDHDELVPRREIAQAPRVEQSRYVVIGTVQSDLTIP